MEHYDRRELLGRGGRLAAAAAVAPATLRRGPTPLQALSRSLQGDLVLPGQAAYAQLRLPYNTRFDGIHPRAVALCETAADVEKTIAWARRHGVPFAARSGGHSYGGYSTTTGMVVDVSRMHGVSASGGRAVVGAGAQLIDVYNALWQHGVTIPGGSCPTVGIAGLALGGGIGFAGRLHGLTCDNVLGLTLVPARGDPLVCNSSAHSDLYWACRGGGGGNFAVVTSFTLRTHPVSNVAWFSVRWPWSDAAAALGAWQDWAPHAPDELFSVFSLSAGSVSSGGQFFGAQADLQRLLQPLASAGAPLRVSVTSGTYMDAVMHWAGCGGLAFPACHLRRDGGTLPRSGFAAKSDYVSRPFSPAAIATALRWIAMGGGSILFDSSGGAINRVAPGATAFVHRGDLFSCQYLTYSGNLGWLRGFHAAMRPYVSGFAYQNYIDPELADWQHAYYGSNLPRLQAVKRRYDPANVFRFRQSIRPR